MNRTIESIFLLFLVMLPFFLIVRIIKKFKELKEIEDNKQRIKKKIGIALYFIVLSFIICFYVYLIILINNCMAIKG